MGHRGLCLVRVLTKMAVEEFGLGPENSSKEAFPLEAPWLNLKALLRVDILATLS